MTQKQWPDPSSPLDLEGILLPYSTTDVPVAWEDDDKDEKYALLDFEIPPELDPARYAPSSSQQIASIDRPAIKSTVLTKENITASRVSTTKNSSNSSTSNSPQKSDSSSSQKTSSHITIPPNGVHHKVRRGETLWDIAKAYGVKCDLLERCNPDINPRRMQSNQKVFIPGSKSQPIAKSQPVTKNRQVAKSRAVTIISPR
ncbi:MAG: LysM peptidoglycan-binding domain-containing protein, partial [Candidatus Hinthialibacter sp.]